LLHLNGEALTHPLQRAFISNITLKVKWLYFPNKYQRLIKKPLNDPEFMQKLKDSTVHISMDDGDEYIGDIDEYLKSRVS
jgi:hypothetical protein